MVSLSVRKAKAQNLSPLCTFHIVREISWVELDPLVGSSLTPGPHV